MGKTAKRCPFSLLLIYIALKYRHRVFVFIHQEADNCPNVPPQPLADQCEGVTLLTVDLCAYLLISFCFKVNNIEKRNQPSTEKFILGNLCRCSFGMIPLPAQIFFVARTVRGHLFDVAGARSGQN